MRLGTTLLVAFLAAGSGGCASVSTITTGGLSMSGQKVEAGRDGVLYYRIAMDFERAVPAAVLAARVELAPGQPFG